MLNLRSLPIAILAALPILVAQAASANSLIVFDMAGRGIGYYAGLCGTNDIVWNVYSATGYIACINKDDGSLQSAIPLDNFGGWMYESGFAAVDCGGTRFAYSNSGAGSFFGGYVFGDLHDSAVYTVNNGSVSTQTQLYSINIPDGVGCQNFSKPPINLYVLPVFENDQAVTGFSNVSYLGPLRIQPAPDTVLADLIFFDSLE
jgi:hypothetical protein